LPQRPPAGEVVIGMRPVSVFANGPESEIEQPKADLHGRWRHATRAVMVLLSAHGLARAQIAALLDCHPATVRRWIGRFNGEGLAGLADRPRSRRPALGGRQLTSRIVACSASGPVDPAAGLAVPGLAAGQPADAVPAGPSGGGMAAAQAYSPRRPGP
jgi:hypothetical protein